MEVSFDLNSLVTASAVNKSFPILTKKCVSTRYRDLDSGRYIWMVESKKSMFCNIEKEKNTTHTRQCKKKISYDEQNQQYLSNTS